MANKVSTAIVLFTKRAKKSGKYPAKLRVTYNRTQRYYSIDTKEKAYEFTPKEFEKIIAPKPRGIYKDIQLEFSTKEEKALKIVDSLKDFSFEDFKTLWGIKGIGSNILTYYDETIKKADPSGNYNSTKKALQKFFKKNDYIDFREITPSKLFKLEEWMLANGYKLSTTYTYLATTRAMFNKAIEVRAIPEDIYPFGRRKYMIKEALNTKRALSTKEIKAIFDYQAEPYSKVDFARDFWVFTYLGNGMNLKDICLLKYKDFGKEFFSYIRSKTKGKTKEQKIISVLITDEALRIIEKWGNKDKSPENYVFPFLKDGLTHMQIKYRVKHRLDKINEGLETISADLGIERKLTTYSARHSFATKLKRSGVSNEFIGECFGHTNNQTTQRYLDSFEDEQKKDIMKHLTAF